MPSNEAESSHIDHSPHFGEIAIYTCYHDGMGTKFHIVSSACSPPGKRFGSGCWDGQGSGAEKGLASGLEAETQLDRSSDMQVPHMTSASPHPEPPSSLVNLRRWEKGGDSYHQMRVLHVSWLTCYLESGHSAASIGESETRSS